MPWQGWLGRTYSRPSSDEVEKGIAIFRRTEDPSMLRSKRVWRAKLNWATSLLRHKCWWLWSVLVSATGRQEQPSSLLICNGKVSRHPSEECNSPPIRLDSCSSVHQGQFSPAAWTLLRKCNRSVLDWWSSGLGLHKERHQMLPCVLGQQSTTDKRLQLS